MEIQHVKKKTTANNWVLEPGKFLTKRQASKLLSIAKHRATVASKYGKKIAVRDYFILHLTLATGLRVMETAALKCGDIILHTQYSCILVRNGKGGKRRMVFFDGYFKKHCREYLKWKQKVGESISPQAPLILSSNTGKHMTTRAIQKVFKRCAERANLYQNYSIHCLRHTYACFLLKASDWNLRLVQKQLGHSKITTTQIYADVMRPDIQNTLNKMFHMYQY